MSVGLSTLVFVISAHAAPVLLQADGHPSNPVFSPDGQMLAFEVHSPRGQIDLHLAPVIGGVPGVSRALVLPSQSAFGRVQQVAINPVWHPNGVLVFEGSSHLGDMRLFFQQSDVGTVSPLVSRYDRPGQLSYPYLSPDGDDLVFVASEGQQAALSLMRVQSSTMQDVAIIEGGDEHYPVLDNLSENIVFTRRYAGDLDLFMVPIAGPSEVPLVADDGHQTRPVFAGEQLLWFSRGSRTESWSVMASDPVTGRRLLGDDVRLPSRGRPAVSPDGQWVVYSSHETGELRMMRVDGSEGLTLRTELEFCEDPTLGVQDDRLLLAYTGYAPGISGYRTLAVEDLTELVQGLGR